MNWENPTCATSGRLCCCLPAWLAALCHKFLLGRCMHVHSFGFARILLHGNIEATAWCLIDLGQLTITLHEYALFATFLACLLCLQCLVCLLCLLCFLCFACLPRSSYIHQTSECIVMYLYAMLLNPYAHMWHMFWNTKYKRPKYVPNHKLESGSVPNSRCESNPV